MRYVTGLIVALACSLALSGPAAAKVLKFEITKKARLLLPEDIRLFVPNVN